MRRFPAIAARFAALLAVCAWLGGSVAQLAHTALVQHVVCAEHGEVVELEGDVAFAHADAPELRSAGARLHEHGCGFELFTFSAASLDLPGVERPVAAPAPTEQPLVRATPPRGPPLAYAPKTSPPLA